MDDLFNLERLLFSNNLIKVLPESILSLEELKELSASDNHFINVLAAKLALT
jgi:Leucine-rich repeat (LRR) protein